MPVQLQFTTKEQAEAEAKLLKPTKLSGPYSVHAVPGGLWQIWDTQTECYICECEPTITFCPHCGKPNPLSNVDGFTDEAPREYHARCWRELQAQQAKIIQSGTYEGKTEAEVLKDRDDYNRICGE